MSNWFDVAFKLVFLVFGAVFLFGSLMLFWGVTRTRNKVSRSQSWPEASGQVTSAEVKRGHYRSGDHFIPEVNYAYSVLGTDYTGKFLLDSQRSDEEATSLMTPFQVGSVLPVRYNPENPQEHVTKQDEITTRLYLIAAGMLVFSALCLYLAFH